MKKSNFIRAFSLMENSDFLNLKKLSALPENFPEQWDEQSLGLENPQNIPHEQASNQTWDDTVREDWAKLADAPPLLIPRLSKLVLGILKEILNRKQQQIEPDGGEIDRAVALKNEMSAKYKELKQAIPPDKFQVLLADFKEMGNAIKQITEPTQTDTFDTGEGGTATLEPKPAQPSFKPAPELPNKPSVPSSNRFAPEGPVVDESKDDYGLGQNWKMQSSNKVKRNS